MTAGGRAAVKLADDSIEIGASYMQEGAASGDTQDRRYGSALADRRRDRAARRSGAQRVGRSAACERAPMRISPKLTHVSERLDARAYVREQEAGFGVGQQLAAKPARARSASTAVTGSPSASRSKARPIARKCSTTGAQRELVSAAAASRGRRLLDRRRRAARRGHRSGERRYRVAACLRQRQRRPVQGSDHAARLAGLRARRQELQRRLPGALGARPRLSLARRARRSSREYEHANGDAFDADMTRVGVRTAPWERAQLQSSMNQQRDGVRSARVREHRPDAGLAGQRALGASTSASTRADDRAGCAGIEPFNADVPLASRLARRRLPRDVRRRDVSQRAVDVHLAPREPPLGRRGSPHRVGRLLSRADRRPCVLARRAMVRQRRSRTASDADRRRSAARLGYRPATSEWIILDRLDLKQDARSDCVGDFESARVDQQSERELAARSRARSSACSSAAATCAAPSTASVTAALDALRRRRAARADDALRRRPARHDARTRANRA